MNGTTDWEDLQPESQTIQILFCWSLTAPLKSNISPSLNVLEREDLGQKHILDRSFLLFSDTYVLQRKSILFNNLINEFGLERCGWDLLTEHKP